MSPSRSAPHPAAAAAVLVPARLAALRRTALLDAAADGAFDRFTRLATRLLGVPVGLVSLVDVDRQVFVGNAGLPEPWATVRETPLTHSFCQHVVATRAPLVVADAPNHPLLCDNRAVPELGVVAYLGVPITADGEVIGSLCAIDTAPRAWSAAEVALLEDLATSVQTELALRASLGAAEEARRTADRLLAASPDGFVAVDGEGRCTYASAPVVRAFGDVGPDAAGARLVERLPPAERAGVAALLARVRATGGPVEGALCVTLPGAPAPRWLAVRAVPDGDGVAAALRDVTPQHEAEAALRASEARYRAVVEQSPEAVFLHRDARLLYANAAAARLVGAPDAAALVGMDVFAAFHPDDRAAGARDLAALMAGAPQHAPKHYRFVLRSGAPLEIESISAVVDVDGAPAVQTLFRDVTERNRLQRTLAHQAFHDSLTGLANRARLLDRARHALARAARGEHVALLYLDLDDFKQVNDSLGHAAGDRLLQVVAERLQRATRGVDTVARLGGDEFAVLLEGLAAPGDVDAVVARVTRALAAPMPVDGREVTARASLGVVHATSAATAEEVLRDADTAMYAAKAGGRGRTATFAPAMRDAVLDRLALEQDLRAAVQLAIAADGGPDADASTPGRLHLAFQPVVALDTGRVVKFEALLRWRHPERGAVSPADFVPLAEDTGLIVPLGRWVLRAACRQLRDWDRAGDRVGVPRSGSHLAVNVSGRQLEDPALVTDVADALAECGLAADRLTLEVTETALMRDLEGGLTALHALKALGVRLAIDDFGMGYSSLAALQRFPVDVLKIDKAFVDRVADGGSAAALARTVIGLGAALGLRTIAEGIETEAQRAALAALGCPLGQGYLFARPLTSQAAWRLLAGTAEAMAGPSA